MTLALARVSLKRTVLDLVNGMFGARASHRVTVLLKEVFPEGGGIKDPFSAGELENKSVASVPIIFR